MFGVLWLDIVFWYGIASVTVFVWRKLRAPGFNVAGKHLFITGGSTGLGLYVAKKFAEKGANVTIVARNVQKLETAVQEVSAAAGSKTVKIIKLSCDVTDADAIKNVVTQAEEANGPIDFLVCNAGTSLPGYFLESTVENHRKQMDVNYFGCLNTAIAAIPGMSERKQGTVVFVSSAVCFAGMIGYSQYAPSKFALRGLADCLRNELLKYNISVVSFFPSNMETPGFEQEQLIKPQETKDIEGSISLIKPEDAAQHLIDGLSVGSTNVTNEFLAELGRIATGGVQPREHFFLELLVAPVFIVVGFGYQHLMDYIARKGPGRS